MSTSLAAVNDEMREAALGWLEDWSCNEELGFGGGVDGVIDAKLSFASALERENRHGVLGIYADDVPAGYVLLSESSPARRKVRFMLFVDPEHRFKGIGTEVLSQLADQVLLSAGVYRLETEILSKRQAAKEWLMRQGFTQESFSKHSWWIDGNPRSTVVLRLLAPTWRKAKKERIEVEEVA